jgi:hypothetical protein
MTGSPLHRLNAASLATPWGLWRLARGGFDEDCDRCGGRGRFVKRGPCMCREDYAEWDGCPDGCSAEHGCAHCLRRCGECGGTGRLPPPEVHADDFGDAASRALAEELMPGLDIDETKRVDWDAPALEGYE